MDIRLNQVLSHFPIEGEISTIKPIGNGHINDTFGVAIVQRREEGCASEEMKYVLQRINHHIFTDVEMLQKNVFLVTEHLRKKFVEAGASDPDRHVLSFLHTIEGGTYHFDGENYWRVCLYIPNSTSIDSSLSPALAYEAGKAFGAFQAMLADLPAEQLGETIPHFHNMEHRLEQFRQACQADLHHRVTGLEWLIQALEDRAEAMCVQERLYRQGKLTKRINHCDTKVNNILFDTATHQVLTVIDLDTVMPGFVLSDIGDFIRTGVNTGLEDDEDLKNIGVNFAVFSHYLRGYMEKAQSFLTPTEIALLPYGGRLLTYMQVVRFLTDYLNGDLYFKTHKPHHNLIRTLAQYEYLKRLEEAQAEMDALVQPWLH